MKSLTKKSYDKYGITEKNNEEYYDNYARSVLIKLACESGVETCLQESAKALEKHLDTTEVLSNYLRLGIVTQGIRTSDETIFWKLWNMHQNSLSTTRRLQILQALGATHNISLLNAYMEISVTANGVKVNNIDLNLKSNERATILNSIIENQFDKIETILKFISENIDKLSDK